MEETFTPAFFRQLQQLKIRTRRAFLGSRQGGHTSQRRGHGLEFSDFRPYAPGDDFRHIDWGVYGRSDRLYVRQFREEQDLNVVVLLDASSSMLYPEGEGKFDLAREVALAVSYVALTDGDTVSICLLGKKGSPRLIGPRAFSRARTFLRECVPSGSFHLLTETRAAISTQQIPGKCFFISDMLLPQEEQLAALDFLRSRNFEIVVLQVLAPSELRLELPKTARAIDAETGEEVMLSLDAASKKEYAMLLASHIETLEEYCRRAGIVHLLISSDESVSDIVLKRFPELGVVK